MNYRTKWFLFFRAIAYNHACATHVLHLSFTCTQFNPRFVGWRLLWPNLFSLFVFYFICGFLNLFRLAIYLLYFLFFFVSLTILHKRSKLRESNHSSFMSLFFFLLFAGRLLKWKVKRRKTKKKWKRGQINTQIHCFPPF